MHLKVCFILNVSVTLLCILPFCKSEIPTDRYCHKCLSIDCSEKDLDCQHIQSLLQSELKAFYYFNGSLRLCPNITYGWRLMQMDDEPCPAEKSGEATCSLGRIEIKSIDKTPGRRPRVYYNYATVLGCAKRALLHRVKVAYDKGKQCDSYIAQHGKSENGLTRHLEIEHCRDVSTYCHQKDYCVDWKASQVKRWKNEEDKDQYYGPFKKSLIYLVGALVLLVLVIGVGSFWQKITGCCSSKRSKSLTNENKKDSGSQQVVAISDYKQLPPSEESESGNGSSVEQEAHLPLSSSGNESQVQKAECEEG